MSEIGVVAFARYWSPSLSGFGGTMLVTNMKRVATQAMVPGLTSGFNVDNWNAAFGVSVTFEPCLSREMP